MFYGLTDIFKCTFRVKPETSSLRKDEFWAIDDINIKIYQGQVCGIIGPNGSGKTTLLKLLAGIYPPDKGEAVISGRVATLLTIGAGFHPHMTVKENIYINGTILGMSIKEINGKFASIIEFSGIHNFIDSPVAILSDGMYVRLIFSIALAMTPDIFLIDELLAVADKVFLEKCIKEIKSEPQKVTILFVSHNLETIRKICNRVIVLSKGAVVYKSDDVDKGIKFYNSLGKQ